MVSLKVNSKEIKDVWDLQRAKKVLEIYGLSNKGVLGLTQEDKESFQREIKTYLWENMLKQFPKLKSFCNGKTGGFNLCEKRNLNTPIINIYGDFYIQLISLNDKNNWCWESISLEPYRFEFNEEGYFKGLIVEAINKAILSGSATKGAFMDLIEALNETDTKEKVLTIKTRGQD